MKRENKRNDFRGVLISIGIFISSIIGSTLAMIKEVENNPKIELFEKVEMIIFGIVFGMICSVIFYSIYKLVKKRK